MHNNESDTPQPLPKMPEHLSIALAFANEMMDRFEPMQQNEMLRAIRQHWHTERQSIIEQAENKIAYMRDSLSDLHLPDVEPLN